MRFTTLTNYIISCITGDFKFEDLYRNSLIERDKLLEENDSLTYSRNVYRLLFFLTLILWVLTIFFLVIK